MRVIQRRRRLCILTAAHIAHAAATAGLPRWARAALQKAAATVRNRTAVGALRRTSGGGARTFTANIGATRTTGLIGRAGAAIQNGGAAIGDIAAVIALRFTAGGRAGVV